MNRRDFLKKIPEGMACSGVSMFVVGRGLQRDVPEKVEERWIDTYDTWLWRIRAKHGNHTWFEIRDTVFYPNDGYFTRPTGARGMFARTKVTRNCYPAFKAEVRDGILFYLPTQSDWA